jgi:hypothetical protein
MRFFSPSHRPGDARCGAQLADEGEAADGPGILTARLAAALAYGRIRAAGTAVALAAMLHGLALHRLAPLRVVLLASAGHPGFRSHPRITVT